MALSKKDLLIHITLNELYNTHSLILQHIEVLVSEPGYYCNAAGLIHFTPGSKR